MRNRDFFRQKNMKLTQFYKAMQASCYELIT